MALTFVLSKLKAKELFGFIETEIYTLVIPVLKDFVSPHSSLFTNQVCEQFHCGTSLSIY